MLPFLPAYHSPPCIDSNSSSRRVRSSWLRSVVVLEARGSLTLLSVMSCEPGWKGGVSFVVGMVQLDFFALMRTLFDFSGRRSSSVQSVRYCGAVLHMQGSYLGAAFELLVYSLVSSRASAYYVLLYRWPLVFFRLANPTDTCDTH